MMHVVAISFSSSGPIAANEVLFWPVEFTTNAYDRALGDPQLWKSLWISVVRVTLGVGLGLFVTSLAGYVLSQGGGRDGIAGYKFFIVFFVIALLFNGGLIPTYLVITGLGMSNSIWALVIPGLTNVFYIVLMLAFIRDIPKSLSEAAFIDGASHFQVFYKIIIPMSVPVMAVVGIFILVFEWNEFFYGQIYMQTDNAPLSTYVYRMLAVADPATLDVEEAQELNNRALSSAQVVFAALPIVLFFPILQKFHRRGITIGSVKE
jgi:putative aldouronate transport system permease protein